jgi:G protein-coupled receptor 158
MIFLLMFSYFGQIVIQYFEPSNLTCILIPWFREIGFAIVYGSLILKIYR